MPMDESKTRLFANTMQGVIPVGNIRSVTQNFFGTSPAAASSKGSV